MPKNLLKLFSKNQEALVLVLDIGTTNIKASFVNSDLEILAKMSVKLKKRSPKSGWVEQDPKEFVTTSKKLIRKIWKEHSEYARKTIAMGITNQRETTILWDTETGKHIYPAIVWQDHRTTQTCAALRRKVSETHIKTRSGLVIDPYFSATKIQWIMKHVPVAKKLLAQNRLAFGTVDTWILHNLTSEKVHLTDYTNACRTLLFHIQDKVWDQWLMYTFGIPPSIVPRIKKSFDQYGYLDKSLIKKELPIRAVIGDQQAALYAAGNTPGTTKITYGTGAFIMQNTGNTFYTHKELFTTLAVGKKNELVYAVEGKVSPCGDVVEKSLGDETKLRNTIHDVAKNIHSYLKHLPLEYKEIIIDGGVTRDGIMREEQEKISGIPIVQQKQFEITTIGTAKLLFDNL